MRNKFFVTLLFFRPFLRSRLRVQEPLHGETEWVLQIVEVVTVLLGERAFCLVLG